MPSEPMKRRPGHTIHQLYAFNCICQGGSLIWSYSLIKDGLLLGGWSVKRKLNSTDVIDVLADLFIARGIRPTSDQTMVLSLWQKPSGAGSLPLVPGRLTLNPAHPGKTAIARVSTQGSGMNCSTGRSSTPSKRHKSSSNSGGDTTTRKDRIQHRDTGSRHRRPSSQ